LSEGAHLAAEPLELRNRLFEFLVAEKGFTAIAIESGLVESRRVQTYVAGGAGELDEVLRDGIGWTFDRLPQNASLVRWMRSYNAQPEHRRKINFYGFDVAGSPGNAQARRGVDTALVEALEYLNRVDAESAAAFRARVGELLPYLRFNPLGSQDALRYEMLSGDERASLTSAVADLLALLDRNEAQYISASSCDDYAWARRAAICARQIDDWLRQMPLGWRPSTEVPEFLSLANDVRDRGQAENLEWIVDREGPDGKVLVYASRYHLSTAPVKTALWGREQRVAGTYLRDRFGDQLFTIGNLIGGGEVGCDGQLRKIESAAPESIEALAADLGTPSFVLDLRAAPTAIANWLNQEHAIARGAATLTLRIGKAFDALYCLESVTPASLPVSGGQS
jgi:erythromycin esterase